MRVDRKASTEPQCSASQQTLSLTGDSLLEVTKFQEHCFLVWDPREKGHFYPS